MLDDFIVKNTKWRRKICIELKLIEMRCGVWQIIKNDIRNIFTKGILKFNFNPAVTNKIKKKIMKLLKIPHTQKSYHFKSEKNSHVKNKIGNRSTATTL